MDQSSALRVGFMWRLTHLITIAMFLELPGMLHKSRKQQQLMIFLWIRSTMATAMASNMLHYHSWTTTKAGTVLVPKTNRPFPMLLRNCLRRCTGIDGFFRINIVPGMRMRVLGDETSFREACSHFPNDELNGVSPAKLERLGQEAVIVNTFIDNTVTCRFDDGAQYDKPATALALLNETGGHSPQQSTHLHARVVPSEYCAHFDARQEVCTPKLSSLATTVRFSQ